jgi:hypothetical protein
MPKDWTISSEKLNELNNGATSSVMEGPIKSGILTNRTIELTSDYITTDRPRSMDQQNVSSEEVVEAF